MALITSSLCTHLKEYWDGNEHGEDGWKSFAQGSKSTSQERTFMSSSTCWWGNSSINHNIRHTATIEKMKAVYMVKPPSTLHNELWPVVPNIFQAGLSTTYYSLWVPNIRDATCQMLQGRPKFLDLEIRLTKIHAFRKEEAVSNIIKLKLPFNQFYASHWIGNLGVFNFLH